MDENGVVEDGMGADPKVDPARLRDLSGEEEVLGRKAHECPIPKPKGVVRRVFGFEQPNRSEGTKSSRDDVQ